MIISLTCPRCKEKISIVHGRLFHHRPREAKNEVTGGKSRKNPKKKAEKSAKEKG